MKKELIETVTLEQVKYKSDSVGVSTLNIMEEINSLTGTSEEILNEIKIADEALKGRGRTLIRASGTEPLIRVMLEGEDEREINDYAQWNYTRKDGKTVLLVLNERTARIYADLSISPSELPERLRGERSAL